MRLLRWRLVLILKQAQRVRYIIAREALVPLVLSWRRRAIDLGAAEELGLLGRAFTVIFA